MNWNTIDQFLLSCVLPTEASQTRLRRLVSERSAEIDWSAVARRADFLQITPLLRFNLAQIGLLNSIPQEIRVVIDETSRVWAARHLAYVNETQRLIEALNAGGVPALPLKGAALMLGGYYPQAGLRTALDIDLLVDPDQIQLAEQIVQERGYAEIPGRKSLRPRQRLANERNHLWPRRGPGGLLLELHHRAFQFARLEKDFGFAEIFARANPPLPAESDLALHLIHHSMVDLQSTHAILRTLTDLHFIFERAPRSREELKDCAREFGFSRVIELADEALQMLSAGTIEEIDEWPNKDVALLIDTALMQSPSALAEAARLFEYFDFSRSPLTRMGNLVSLVFTSRSHLAQLYGEPGTGNPYFNYLRRPFDLLRRFNWASLAPANLRRVSRLRKLAAK